MNPSTQKAIHKSTRFYNTSVTPNLWKRVKGLWGVLCIQNQLKIISQRYDSQNSPQFFPNNARGKNIRRIIWSFFFLVLEVRSLTGSGPTKLCSEGNKTLSLSCPDLPSWMMYVGVHTSVILACGIWTAHLLSCDVLFFLMPWITLQLPHKFYSWPHAILNWNIPRPFVSLLSSFRKVDYGTGA